MRTRPPGIWMGEAAKTGTNRRDSVWAARIALRTGVNCGLFPNPLIDIQSPSDGCLITLLIP